MAVGFFISARGKLRDMRLHQLRGQIEMHRGAGTAPGLPRYELNGVNIGYEVYRHVAQRPHLPIFGKVVILVGIKTIEKGKLIVEDKIEIVKYIHDQRRIGHGEIARRLDAAAVEMLVRGV